MTFAGLQRNHYAAILCDPPWGFVTWSDKGRDRSADNHYKTLRSDALAELPVAQLAADDCVLFVWAVWPLLHDCLNVIEAWGFRYKTCAFAWMKAVGANPSMGLGYWTRASSEVCLLATKGKPKRLNADVRQGIIEPRREHSRKPDCVHDRIERLVSGPYLELFARARRPGWDVWGNEVDKFTVPA